MAKRFAIGDQELQIACVRSVDEGEIDFVDDAMAKGEPHARAAVIRRADAALGAGCPPRLDSRCAKGDGFIVRHTGIFMTVGPSGETRLQAPPPIDDEGGALHITGFIARYIMHRACRLLGAPDPVHYLASDEASYVTGTT